MTKWLVYRRHVDISYNHLWLLNLCCDGHWLKTRSSATAEKQRVSCACLPRLAITAQNTADSQSLYYFLTFKRSDSRSAGRKRILTWNSQPLKVIQGHSFCIQLPADNYRHILSSYNIAGLISEDSEEIASQIAKNCRRQPHSHLTPPPRGTPSNIPIHLIFPETRIIGLHFCRW